ncbi:ABC transporter permease [Frankia sp. Cr1]|uniref:ABC transporter permease n=1 Tax=Frankia sp. Cr1 TaxID=3073931 RepID=UPI002AD2A6D3|nr:ABC transporter permease [Frankia sp. Cr1]
MGNVIAMAVGLGALLAVAVGCLTVAGVRLRRAVIVAAVRAGAQLTLVGLALRGVLAAPATTVAVLVVMLTVATLTAAGRLTGFPDARRSVLAASTAGAAVTLGIIFGVPLLDRSARYLVAAGGIVIGGTMTACTLAGRRLFEAMVRRRDEVEAWLALGATPRQAVADLARTAIQEALLPAVDQTRTVGLVTLPGAFVGALLGGASPTDAARFQLVVLVALLTAETLAAVTLVWLFGAPTHIPDTDVPNAHGSRAGGPRTRGPRAGGPRAKRRM